MKNIFFVASVCSLIYLPGVAGAGELSPSCEKYFRFLESSFDLYKIGAPKDYFDQGRRKMSEGAFEEQEEACKAAYDEFRRAMDEYNR